MDYWENCDDAVGKFDSAIAMTIRDWRGNLVFACSIEENTNIPVQSESEALKWAVSTVMKHKLINVFLKVTVRFASKV